MNKESSSFDYLIPIMKERPMTREEIKKENQKRGLTIYVDTVLFVLSNRCPIYDVSPGVYKILTQEDLNKYERMRKNERK